MRYTNFLKIFEMQYLKSQPHNNLRDFCYCNRPALVFLTKRLNHTGFSPKGCGKKAKSAQSNF